MDPDPDTFSEERPGLGSSNPANTDLFRIQIWIRNPAFHKTYSMPVEHIHSPYLPPLSPRRLLLKRKLHAFVVELGTSSVSDLHEKVLPQEPLVYLQYWLRFMLLFFSSNSTFYDPESFFCSQQFREFPMFCATFFFSTDSNTAESGLGQRLSGINFSGKSFQ